MSATAAWVPPLAAPPPLADRLLAEAGRLMERGQPAEAMPLALTATRLAPSAPAWMALGRARAALSDAPGTIEACGRAIDLGGDSAEALLMRARAHARLGNAPALLADAAGAVCLAPRSTEARILLAHALLMAEEYDEALAVLGDLWREQPEDPVAALRLAEAFQRAGRREAAEELASSMLDTISLTPAQRRLAHGVLAQCALTAGDPVTALHAAQRGIADAGADMPLLSLSGHARLNSGDATGAARDIEAALALAPQDGYLRHLSAALNDDVAEGRAPDAYVAHLFDGYARRFEASLFGLGYRVPGLMLRALEELRPGLSPARPIGDVLDLGCGTGLVGVVLHDMLGGRLVGVDLSPAMLREAETKQVYSSLHRAELGNFLRQDHARYQAVIAADVFCYFGELQPAFALVAPRLAPGGHFLFSVELGEGTGWELAGSGRYRHGLAAVEAALAGAGLTPVLLRREVLRTEREQPVQGLLIAATVAP
ncbi:methyltransferase domain-containing protein [Rhodovarius crocodyli]|nr:methyltransferase domain-containing protein [Rhodovarius crocodyli]